MADNRNFRITEESPLVSNTNPFELFGTEIYSFDNRFLIEDLLRIHKLLKEANTHLVKYFKNKQKSDAHENLFLFLRIIERLKPEVTKVISEKILASYI